MCTNQKSPTILLPTAPLGPIALRHCALFVYKQQNHVLLASEVQRPESRQEQLPLRKRRSAPSYILPDIRDFSSLDRFWTAYRNKTARQVAATLRHIRGKAINIDEFKLVEEVDTMSHEEHMNFEQDRMTHRIAYGDARASPRGGIIVSETGMDSRPDGCYF